MNSLNDGLENLIDINIMQYIKNLFSHPFNVAMFILDIAIRNRKI